MLSGIERAPPKAESPAVSAADRCRNHLRLGRHRSLKHSGETKFCSYPDIAASMAFGLDTLVLASILCRERAAGTFIGAQLF
jgi:hypothetical protein